MTSVEHDTRVNLNTTDGTIVSIRGGVVDVAFNGAGPLINTLLYAGETALQVMSLIGENVVRCIALGIVRGLGLGMAVSNTGTEIKVPVGEGVLGRMLNVFGAPIDGAPAPQAK